MSKKDKKASSARSSLGIFATELIMYPIAFAVSILVTRILGPSDRGIYAFLLTVNGSLLPLLTFGFTGGVVYYISSKQVTVKQGVYECVTVGALHGMLTAVAVWFMWDNGWFGETGNAIEWDLLLPTLLILPLDGICFVLTSLIQAESDFTFLNAIKLLKTVIPPVLLVALVVLGDLGLYGAIIAVVVAKATLAILVLSFALWYYKPTLGFNLDFLRRSYSYGIRAWVGTLGSQANARFDHFLLGVMVAPEFLGYYSVADRLLNVAAIPASGVMPVLLNQVARIKDTKKSALLMEQVHRTLVLVVGALCVLLAVGSWWFIPFLYGPDFAVAVVPFIVLLPGMLAMRVSRRAVDRWLRGTGHPGRASLIHSIGGTVGVGLYIVFIPLFGLIGAATASTLGDIVALLVAVWIYHRIIAPTPVRLFRFSWQDVLWTRRQLTGAFQVIWQRTRKQLCALT